MGPFQIGGFNGLLSMWQLIFSKKGAIQRSENKGEMEKSNTPRAPLTT